MSARGGGPALLALLAGLAGCQRVGGPNVQLQRMMVQPRYEPYGASRFFADGKAMQAPPAGTVARGDPVGPMTPPAPDSATLALGQDRYQVACAPCHGAGGFGGAMVARNLGGIPGLDLQTPAVRAYSLAQLFARLGGPGDVRHARAHELSPGERWAVVLYARALVAATTRTEAARQDSIDAAGRLRMDADMAAQLTRLNGVAP